MSIAFDDGLDFELHCERREGGAVRIKGLVRLHFER